MIKIKFSINNLMQTISHGLLYLLNKITKQSPIIWEVTSYRETYDGEIQKVSSILANRYDLTEWLFIDAELSEGIDEVRIISKKKSEPEKPDRWNK